VDINDSKELTISIFRVKICSPSTMVTTYQKARILIFTTINTALSLSLSLSLSHINI
jgi:hypothetical protein